MKRLLLLILAAVLIPAVAALYVNREVETLYAPPASVILEIPKGLRARDVVGLLESKNVIRSRYPVFAYILYKGLRHKLMAGEYLFDHPMTAREVVSRIANGTVYLHRFTVPEGLIADAIASKWEQDGFGGAPMFRQAVADSLDLIQDVDPEARSLEGYLYPETYSFPAHTPPRKVIEAMVGRFKSTVNRLEAEVPRNTWPLNFRDTVILASMIEAEAARKEERPLVASVYLNRIGRNILLQCDPTVIYALEQADQYSGKLTLADLKFKSAYNTYMNPGLPPGPITNPGYPSLKAAVQPAATAYLYFVRTADGKHTFSDNLAAHNRAVAAYRLLQKKPK